MVAGVERNEMIATMEDIRSNWGSDLLPMIQDLIKPCRKLFLDAFRYQVTHEQFIGVLKKWLADYGIPQERYNNCPVYVSLLLNPRSCRVVHISTGEREAAVLTRTCPISRCGTALPGPVRPCQAYQGWFIDGGLVHPYKALQGSTLVRRNSPIR
jgi:hypothetical protein